MDPKGAPDFTPPSLNHHQNPPLASSSEIPTADPIVPLVLADIPNELDAPIKPRKHRMHHHHHHHHHSSSSTSYGASGTPSYSAATTHGAPHGATHGATHTPSLGTSPVLSSSLSSSIPRIHGNLQPPSSNENSTDGEGEGIFGADRSYFTDVATNATNATNRNADHSNGDENTFAVPQANFIQSHQTADLEEVPHGIIRQAKKLNNYDFPTHRLVHKISDPNKFPLIIVACGSFSPITYLHLRMFEMAVDAINEQTRFEVVGGYYSPVSDNYKKRGLAPAHHRVRMCELACERTSSWLMVDAWESLQPLYTRTAKVLDHFNEEINVKRGGVLSSDESEKIGVKIMLLAGGDLIESMGEPNVWADEDLNHILGRYGCLIVERTGSDVRSFLLSHDIMYEHRRNVLVIKQLIYNDISSTKVRLFIRRGMSVQYLLPNSVIRYIQEHGLYVNEPEPVKQVLDSKD